jgi:hypothetical protein
MIYNNQPYRRLDRFNQVYPLQNKTRELYDCFSIKRANGLKTMNIGNDVIATYNNMKFKEPKYINKDQKGSGIGDILSVAGKISNLIQQGYDAYGSQTATNIKNMYIDSFMNPNELSRPAYSGERHLIMNDGSMANYAGPNTRLMSRLRRGDQPIDILDAQAKIHDIDYKKARNVEDIKRADQKLINSMDRIKGNNPMKTVIKAGMKGKQMAHKLGLPKNTFTGRNILSDGKSFDMTKQDKEDIKELEQMGLKLNRKKDPLKNLREKIANMK